MAHAVFRNADVPGITALSSVDAISGNGQSGAADPIEYAIQVGHGDPWVWPPALLQFCDLLYQLNLPLQLMGALLVIHVLDCIDRQDH
jgi:hypothetical protein